jgi:hypothetical protein
LFPAERILRNIIGLRSSTLGQLKFSGAAMIGAGITAFSLARNGTRMAAAEGRHGNQYRPDQRFLYPKSVVRAFLRYF